MASYAPVTNDAGNVLLACVLQVMYRQALGLPPGPYRLATLPDRLIIAHAQGVVLLDTSTSVRRSPHPLASHFTQELWALYGLQQHAETPKDCPDGLDGQQLSSCLPPLLATDGAQTVMLSLGSRAAAVFVLAGDKSSSRSSWGSAGSGRSTNWLQAVQPFFVILMMGVGVWQFLRASNSRRDRFNPGGARQLGFGQRDAAQVLTGRYGGTRAGMGRRANGVLGGSRAGSARAYQGGGYRDGSDADADDADLIARLARIDGRLSEQDGRMSSIYEGEE